MSPSRSTPTPRDHIAEADGIINQAAPSTTETSIAGRVGHQYEMRQRREGHEGTQGTRRTGHGEQDGAGTQTDKPQRAQSHGLTMERKRRMFNRRCPSRLHEQLATRGEPERNFSVKQTAHVKPPRGKDRGCRARSVVGARKCGRAEQTLLGMSIVRVEHGELLLQYEKDRNRKFDSCMCFELTVGGRCRHNVGHLVRWSEAFDAGVLRRLLRRLSVVR